MSLLLKLHANSHSCIPVAAVTAICLTTNPGGRKRKIYARTAVDANVDIHKVVTPAKCGDDLRPALDTRTEVLDHIVCATYETFGCRDIS